MKYGETTVSVGLGKAYNAFPIGFTQKIILEDGDDPAACRLRTFLVLKNEVRACFKGGEIVEDPWIDEQEVTRLLNEMDAANRPADPAPKPVQASEPEEFPATLEEAIEQDERKRLTFGSDQIDDNPFAEE